MMKTVVVLAAFLAGCGSNPEGKAPVDATPADVAVVDAAADVPILVTDTPIEPDEGPPDAGPPDTGPVDTAPPEDLAPPKAEYQPIEAATLHGWLEAKDFLLINVHVPYAGDLPDTDANVAYTNLGGLIDALSHDKSTKVVLYCLTGPMSFKAANDLVDLGYWNVYDLKGGMNAWKAAGYAIEQNPPK